MSSLPVPGDDVFETPPAPGWASEPAPAFILLDALGTIVELADPHARFQAGLERRGVLVDAADARVALRAEMSFYRAHCQSAGDEDQLRALRRRCAELLLHALPSARELGPEAMLDALLAALRFAPYPDAVRALRRWRAAGARIAVVSNWDVSLHGVLAECGLSRWIEVTVTSAEAGAAKPDSGPFLAALDRLGAHADQAVHVGDTPAEDVAGAQAAGVRPVLVRREVSSGPPVTGVGVVASLDELWP